MLFYLLFVLYQIGWAEEITLYYTTDISQKPSLWVESQRELRNIPLHQAKSEADYQKWEGKWTQEDAPLFQIYLQHEEESDSVSTIHFGKKNPQTINIFNDTQNETKQFLSDRGSTAEIAQKEESWLFERWLYLISIVLGFLFLKALSSKGLPKLPSFFNIPLIELSFFLLLSAWWQRSLFFIDGLPAKYHDSLGTFWLIAQAHTWDGFIDINTEFPVGADYSSLDSYLLWFMAFIFRFIPPLFFYKSWLILSPALSAWGASFWSKDWGATAPFSWIAGLGFGFSGLMANAIFEGQIYQTLLLWLPLAGCVWWRFLSGMGRMYLGFTVIFLTLCLFSSSYIGASCLILLFGLWLGGKAWTKFPFFGLLIITCPIFALHYYLMTASSMHIAKLSSKMSIGSISLVNFWGATPEMFREGHAIELGVLLVPLLLALQLRHAESEEKPWMPLGVVALLSLLIGFGPSLTFSNTEMLFPLPTSWFLQLPVLSSLSFPIRLAQPFLLVTSITGAVILSRMVQRRRWLALLLPIAILEVALDDLSEKQDFWNIEAPDLERSEDAGIFTLTPLTPPHYKGTDAEMSLYMLDCAAQVSLDFSITNNCLSTNIPSSKQKKLQKELLLRILENKSIVPLLKENQIEYLLYYPELFQAEDRRRVERQLQHQGSLVIEGAQPLGFQMYTFSSITAEAPKSSDTSSLALEIITTLSYQEPLQILGNGIFLETRSTVQEQQVIHRATIQEAGNTAPILLQTRDGKKIWEGTLYPNPGNDKILIRAESGPQIELPILDSPAVPIPSSKWVFWLWGTLGFFGLFSMIRIRIPKENITP